MFRRLHHRSIKATFAICVSMCATSAIAQTANLADVKGRSDGDSVSVLQNRFFLKAYRPEVGLLVGTFLNEAYTKTTFKGARASLFFNEWIGAEVQFLKTNVKDTEDRKALNDLRYRHLTENREVTPDPEVNPIKGGYDLNAIIAPFYGKLNLLNQYIVYSDLYLTTGLGKIDTEQGGKSTFQLGAGQRFYVMKALSFRVDWRMRSFVEKRRGSDSRRNAQSIDFGISYFFL